VVEGGAVVGRGDEGRVEPSAVVDTAPGELAAAFPAGDVGDRARASVLVRAEQSDMATGGDEEVTRRVLDAVPPRSDDDVDLVGDGKGEQPVTVIRVDEGVQPLERAIADRDLSVADELEAATA